ncbi:DNA-binding NarL/FixJ family response regulator [Azospirillum picis]|uniref:DNA-binding NarL/FixJ family response regulator n=2 Tax=Azospirillum picis TaxID=488438 RepID=A0ABU0ME36_9PROT|nr:DNA-binding NarL/FixJ family response regulator [Azospirillum picis]MDQ0531683.1 DNA-binding NarL/FixJ family response regulator [Azospirillum picis]
MPSGYLPAHVSAALRTEAGTTSSRGVDAITRLSQLSAREVDVLVLLAAGRTSKVAAHELGISPKTLEVHRARIMEKLSCSNPIELGRLWEAAVWSGLRPRAVLPSASAAVTAASHTRLL